jgi:hypothetical protein
LTGDVHDGSDGGAVDRYNAPKSVITLESFGKGRGGGSGTACPDLSAAACRRRARQVRSAAARACRVRRRR